MAKKQSGFLPISKEDMLERGWYYCDFLLVTGDAYVDHPSFGVAIISRVLCRHFIPAGFPFRSGFYSDGTAAVCGTHQQR